VIAGVGLEPFSVAAADLNGDGNPDILVSIGINGGMLELFGDGSGGFGSSYVSRWPGGTALVGDFTGDGRADILLDAVSNQSLLLATPTPTAAGAAYNISKLPATVTAITASPASGDIGADQVVTITLTMSKAITVSGGTPTLALNDGGTATYTGGSGNALTFSYVVHSGDQAANLGVTGIDLHGATAQDSVGNTASFAFAPTAFSGLQIDGVAPTVMSAAASPGVGDLDADHTVTITLGTSEAVTVTGGTRP